PPLDVTSAMTPPRPPTALPTAPSAAVKAISGARTGRILRIKGMGKRRTASLDIGSEAGLTRGALLSLGGVGPGHSLWIVTEVQRYTSTAIPASGEKAARGAPGQEMIRVRKVR
ncbi:MAG: hypothetical protein ACYTGH_16910, partial [Planctomycetota bacterium]